MSGDGITKDDCKDCRKDFKDEINRVKDHREDDLKTRDDKFNHVYREIKACKKDVETDLKKYEEKRSKIEFKVIMLIISTLVALMLNLFYMEYSHRRYEKQHENISQQKD